MRDTGLDALSLRLRTPHPTHPAKTHRETGVVSDPPTIITSISWPTRTALFRRMLTKCLSFACIGQRSDTNKISEGSDDTVVPGHAADGAVTPTPQPIVALIKKKWLHHFSLAVLTDAHCARIAAPFRSGKAIASSTSSSSDFINDRLAEEDMSYDEWTQAWRRLFELLHKHMNRYVERWRWHYNFIDSRPTRSKQWRLWLAYDIQLRQQTRQDKRIDVMQYHTAVWNDVFSEHLLAMKAEEPLRASGGYLSRKPSPPRVGGSSGSYRTSTTRNSTSSSKPFTNGDRPSNSYDAAPSSSPATGRCFRCGGENHIANDCTAERQASGRSILIQFVEKGVWTLNGGKFCYKHNGSNGPCKRRGCKFGAHVCSLCGSLSHTAQTC